MTQNYHLKKCIVITTINKENDALRKFSEIPGYDLIIVGDKKSPGKYDLNAIYLDIKMQQKLFRSFSDSIPFNHYSRKNLGYLYAMANGYSVIVESDDDNFPYNNWGRVPQGNVFSVIITPKFPNVYREFTEQKIWPRGFPLDLILQKQKNILKKKTSNVVIWQGLVDGDADVDAIYRLIINKNIKFKKGKIVVLAPGVVSAFNSQNTIWRKKAFPFLYLPHTVTFRYTDILRSFIAQYGIRKLESVVGFMSPTASQLRNYHNILKDFKDECPMHYNFYRVIEILEKCVLKGNATDLLVMYEELFKGGVVQRGEITSTKKWLNIIKNF